MKSVILFTCFLAFLISSSEALKCYHCIDCQENYGNTRECGVGKDVCLKAEIGSRVVRQCSDEDLCDMTRAERAATRAWNNILNLFRDVDQDVQMVYCCDSDYCNSAFKNLPSFAVILLPLIVASFFKN